jgi:dehydrogenase/reductase SDR family protein 12
MDLRGLVDGLLELAVIPSFSRVGALVRAPLLAWEPPAADSLVGRTALVTGATGGLGRATAAALADLGARVVLLGRDASRLAALRADLAAQARGRRQRDGDASPRFSCVVADMSSLADVRRVVDEIRIVAPVLDLLVDNAGAIFAERTAAPDGGEASMALMVVGPFALISGLLPTLSASPDARVISVASGGMYAQPLDVDDLDGETIAYNGPRFYARAKRAQVALVREWARRMPTDPVTFLSMHPGWVATPGLSASLPTFEQAMGPILRTPAQGIDTIVWLATAPRPEVTSGRLYLDRRPRPFDRVPWTRLSLAERRRLWDEVVERAGVSDPSSG